MFGIPYNSIAWLLGFFAVYTFGFRSLLAYRETGNQVAKIYFGMTMAYGLGFFTYGILGVFTLDPNKLLISYVLGDLGVQIGIQFQVWLLWFIGLRNRLRLRYLLIASFSFSTILMILEAYTSKVSVSPSPLLFVSVDIPVVLVMKCILYIAICWPLGYFFLTQSRLQPTTRAKVTSISTGLLFLIVSGAAVLNSITSGGSDTYESSLIDAGIFLIFWIVNLIPRKLISYEHRTVATST